MDTAPGGRAATMAKWLNKYFGLGSGKSRSAPQPPRPDYREQRNGAARPDGGPRNGSSPGLRQRGPCEDTSELLRAYRAQRERDFEDPYGGGAGSWPSGPRAPGARGAARKHRLVKVESGGGQRGRGGEGPAPLVPSAKKEKVVIPDDYSDPFDSKSELNKMRKGESTGYMEPYEAQRIMTEFQQNYGQQNEKPHGKSLQLYDMPYEPEGSSVESDSDSVVSQHLRESRLPQDDDRPADEYDQPWEWNKVTLPALAAQFNGSKKQETSSSSNDQHRQLQAPGGGFKPIKHGSPEFCGILGERIDPTIALEKQIWYHGGISRTDAENLLRLCKECSYLVRNSQTSKHDYSLSLKSSQGFMHMKLMKTKEKYILGQNSPPFDTVPEVIHYYTTRKLPIKGAEHLSLLYPVAVRTL